MLPPDMQRRLLLEVRRSGDAALLLSEGNRDANIQGALAAPYVLGSSRHLCRVEQGSTFELGEVHNYPADMNASATRPNGVAGHGLLRNGGHSFESAGQSRVIDPLPLSASLLEP